MSNEYTALATVATGTLISVSGGLAVVRPNGTGPDGAAWPDIPDCRLIHPSGNGGSAGLRMLPAAGDACVLIFDGHDMTSPLCLPVHVAAGADTVDIYNGKSRAVLMPDTVWVMSDVLRVECSDTIFLKARSISVDGKMHATDVEVSGSIRHKGKSIGADHKHGSVQAGRDQSGDVV